MRNLRGLVYIQRAKTSGYKNALFNFPPEKVVTPLRSSLIVFVMQNILLTIFTFLFSLLSLCAREFAF